MNWVGVHPQKNPKQQGRLFIAQFEIGLLREKLVDFWGSGILNLTFTCHDCIAWIVWMLHRLVLANIREFHQQER